VKVAGLLLFRENNLTYPYSSWNFYLITIIQITGPQRLSVANNLVTERSCVKI